MKKIFRTTATSHLMFFCVFFLLITHVDARKLKSDKKQETSSPRRRRPPKVYPKAYPNNNNNPRPNNRRPTPIYPKTRPRPGVGGRRPRTDNQNGNRNKTYPQTPKTTKTNQTVKKTKAPGNDKQVPATKKTKSPGPNSADTNDPATKTCRLCTSSYKVPSRRLVLLDKKCSDWRQDDFSEKDCRNVQATIGAACQCRSAPKPKCDVCGEGRNLMWNEDPFYNSMADDYCVKIIFKMSQKMEFCEENKERVAKMCCSEARQKVNKTSSHKSGKRKTPKGDKTQERKNKRGRDSGDSNNSSGSRKSNSSHDGRQPSPSRPTKSSDYNYENTYHPTYYPTPYYYGTYYPTYNPTVSPITAPPVNPTNNDRFDYYYYDDYYYGDDLFQ